MLNLSVEHEKLKEKYRLNFRHIANEIETELDNLTNDDKIKYLKNRLKILINKTKAKILTNRSKYKCVGCGTCCKFALSEFSPKELQQKAKNGDRLAKEFISTFIKYNHEKEYRNIYPQYLSLLKNFKYFAYHCPKITKDNKCSDYVNRPKICRDFPDNPIAFLPISCGFSQWREESEDLWLKLYAETEIINYILSKIS